MKTLISLWQMSYLDVSIMTYNQTVQMEPYLCMINPFKNRYLCSNITSAIQWFPDKLQDLNGFKIDMNLYAEIADDELKMNVTRKNVVEIFEQAMNFKHEIGITSPLKRHVLIDFQQLLLLNNYELFISTVALRVIKIDRIQAVVPRMEKFATVFEFSSELFYMILGTIGLIVIISGTASFLKFNATVWKRWNICKIIIGVSSSQEPNKWSERILFGSLLLICTVYTGYFYSTILDTNLHSESVISTLEELADSSLIPFGTQHLCQHLNQSSISHLKKLGNKCQNFPIDMKMRENDCLEFLAKNKNVSCMYANAEYHVNSFVNSDELNVKIIPEAVDYYINAWLSLGNSPLTDRYNEIILKISEFGLNKHNHESNALSRKDSPPEDIKKSNFLFITSYVLGIGYSISLVVFLIELLIEILHKRIYTSYTRLRLEMV